jgi:galactosylceramidase
VKEEMAETVRINGSVTGRTFAAIGGITSNGMTKLLREYPPGQRDDILDLLFKPKFGASFHLLKIEIGSDANGTCGTEPSHMRSDRDFDITRGAGLWLGREAKDRNPAILLDAIRWGIPAWVKTDQDKYLYYKKFLEGARDVFDLRFDYLAPDENEGAFSRDYTVNILRPGLDTGGFGYIRLAAADSVADWDIAFMAARDNELRNSLYAINAHYRQDSPDEAKNCGLQIFDSEDLAPFRNNFSFCLNMADRIIRSYVSGKMVMYQMHPIIEAIYDHVPYTHKGILRAAHPWTGHFEIDKGLWVTAQFTQFISPGWIYVDSGCSSGTDNSYLTLKDPAAGDFSIIILNRGNREREYIFILEGLEADFLYLWGTDNKDQFYQSENVPVKGGRFTVTVPAETIYTLTTTRGQQKGCPKFDIPEKGALDLPYLENFEKYKPGKQPGYTVDQAGAFEIAEGGKGGGNCLKQIISLSQKPVDWKGRASPSPYTILGDQDWKNYRLSLDFYLEQIDDPAYQGYVLLGARCNFSPTGDVPAECYNLKIFAGGQWQFGKGDQVLDSGAITNMKPNAWYQMRICLEDDFICSYFEDLLLCSLRDQELPSGNIIIGSGYNQVRFDNLRVEAIDDNTPVNCLRYDETDPQIKYAGLWSSLGTDAKNYTRTLLVSNQTGDFMEFSFNGTSVSVLGKTGVNCGKADVYLDGIYQQTVDAYSDPAKYRRSLFSAYKLKPGNHKIRLAVSGEKNRLSSDNYIALDAVEICGGTGLIVENGG